jgi:hypothetical protein
MDMSNQSMRWLIPLHLCAVLGVAGCDADPAPAFRMGDGTQPLATESTGLGTTGGSSTSDTSDTSDTGDTGDTGDTEGAFVDLWEPGEIWLDEFEWLSEEDEASGSDTGGSDTGGSDTGGSDTGGAAPPMRCADGEFTIIVLVKHKYGAEGTVSLAAGTITKVGEETEGGVVNKEYLACIPADKIVGPMAPGVRITAAVAGTNADDRVVGMRRGIDRNWIGQCLGNPAKSCWIDAKFNANGTNTLPIAVAVVVVELARRGGGLDPREVIK